MLGSDSLKHDVLCDIAHSLLYLDETDTAISLLKQFVLVADAQDMRKVKACYLLANLIASIGPQYMGEAKRFCNGTYAWTPTLQKMVELPVDAVHSFL
jgi:hypothetical protein